MSRCSLLLLLAGFAAACNTPPAPAVVAIAPEQPDTTHDLVVEFVQASVDENKNDVVAYSFVWSVDGQVRDDLKGNTVPASETTRDELWSVRVIPSDGKSAGPPAEEAVTIGNAPPTVELAVLPESPLSTDDLVVNAVSVDPDDDQVQLSWSWTVDGKNAGITGNTVPAGRTRRGETWEVTVVPQDPRSKGEPVVASVVIENQAPEVHSVVLIPEPLYTDSTIEVRIDASDADRDDLTYHYGWMVNGVDLPDADDEPTLGGRYFERGDFVAVEVSADDGVSRSRPVQSTSVDVRNSSPQIASVRIDPAEATAHDTLSCEASGWLDADGDAEDYHYEWLVNGVVKGTAATADGSLFRKEDRVVCRLTPFDGSDPGVALSSRPLVIDNALPVLKSLSIGPAGPTAGSTLIGVLGETSDADDERVRVDVDWYVNGSFVERGGALVGDHFKKKDTIYALGTPTDGDGKGLAVKSNTLTAVNSLPEITSLSVSPASVYTDTLISASVVTADADKDTVKVRYTWKVNGTVVGTGATLSGGSWFDKGDTIELTVTPNDGDGDGAVRTRTLKVKNTAPTEPGITLGPATPKATDTLRCVVTTASVDADRDRFTYDIAWERNGIAYAGASTTYRTGDTIAASVTRDGETWTCFVSADDGDDVSDEADDEVSIGGGVVPGFSGLIGPTFSGWTQCEGYLDVSGGDQIPAAWGDDCTDKAYNKIKLVCGTGVSSYRYIDVKKNVFRDKLASYPETGLVTAFKDQAGTSMGLGSNRIYATSNDPHRAQSWWVEGNGCGETYKSLTVNNSCTYEASNCFGQGISGSRYLWVYVAP